MKSFILFSVSLPDKKRYEIQNLGIFVMIFYTCPERMSDVHIQFPSIFGGTAMDLRIWGF
jgi:hypothetical protein